LGLNFSKKPDVGLTTDIIRGMFSEIKKRLNLSQINEFTRDECEDRLMLLRYLIRRENTPKIQEEFCDYIQKIEKRLALLGDEDAF
jgi:hypothetical protein